MSLPRLSLCTAAVLLALSTLNAQSVTTAPVGAITQQVAAGSGSGTFTFLGFPLVSQASFAGVVSSVAGSTLNISSASFTSGAFASSGSYPTYYVIVTSGANSGLMVDISSNSATSLALAEDVSGLISASDKLEVRAHATLSKLFGVTNSAGFGGGANASGADEIRIFNPTTQGFVTYYYKSSGVGGTGWRSTGLSGDQAAAVIYPEQSIVIYRKQASSLSITSVGEVYTGQMKIPAESGFTWVSNTSPVATTIANLGFYTGSSATGLTGSNALSSADELWKWTGSSWQTFYYKSSGVGGTGWRSNSTGSNDVGATSVAPGEPLLVRRKSSSLLLTKAAPTIASN